MFYKKYSSHLWFLLCRFLLLLFLLFLGMIQSFAQIGDCDIASTALNETDTVAIQIGYVQPYYLELELLNPSTDLMAMSFQLLGLEILAIDALIQDSLHIYFDGETIAICAPQGIAAQNDFRPLVGIHVFYTQATGPICVPETAVFINASEEQIVYESAGYCAILECPESFDGIDGDAFNFNGRPFPPCGETSTNLNPIESRNSSLEFVSIEPMPVKNWAEVNFHSNKNEAIEILIYNQTGQLMEQKKIEANEGDNQIKLDLSAYGSGTYFLSLGNTQQGMRSQKLIIN